MLPGLLLSISVIGTYEAQQEDGAGTDKDEAQRQDLTALGDGGDFYEDIFIDQIKRRGVQQAIQQENKIGEHMEQAGRQSEGREEADQCRKHK